MIQVRGGATPEETAAIVAALAAMTPAEPQQFEPARSPWKFAALHPELDIDALRHAQGKRIVL